LLTVSRSFMNVANSVLWRTAIILKAKKVNLFVSSVLFVFWYHSPNFLDTPCMYSSCLVLELVGVSRASENGDESVWIKMDDHRIAAVTITECVCSLPKLPVLFRKVRGPRPSGNFIQDTFPTRATPDTTPLL
jgi:hypothetical protein